jgi:hypothetical protein
MNKATTKISEADLAAAVQRRLIAEGWDCFAEVQMRQGDKRADMVAVRPGRVAIIETKLSLSIDVLSQAVSWLGKAHHVIVAVPAPKNPNGARQEFIVDYLKTKGIGLWWVDGVDQAVWGDYDPVRIRERVRAATHRFAHAATKELRKALVPEMRDAQAGAKIGGIASTPFKRTCLELKKYVFAHPGTSFATAIRIIRHHYSSEASAKASVDLLTTKAGLILEHGLLWPKDFDRSRVTNENAEALERPPHKVNII